MIIDPCLTNISNVEYLRIKGDFMKCMHCPKEYHPTEEKKILGQDEDGVWAVFYYLCPACNRYNCFLSNGDWGNVPDLGLDMINEKSRIPIRPLGHGRPLCPEDVTEEIADDYTESCKVIHLSAKASAALSRRCLQNLLREKANITPGKLYNEIQQVIDSCQLPIYLAESIDAIRVVGNFAAHPIKSERTGEIIPVEPGEAEWNLDVLELLFDFYFVQPEALRKKREALNEKLNEAGKNPMQ